MLKAGRGRILLKPLGTPEAQYVSPGGIVVPRAKPERKAKGAGMEHAPLFHGEIIDIGPPDIRLVGQTKAVQEDGYEVGDTVIYHQDRPADVFWDGSPYDVILQIDVLAFEPKRAAGPKRRPIRDVPDDTHK